MSNILNNRYEFVLYFDVENGNPNGDPDAGNMPRIDPQTGYGIITDVCLKRKVRNFVEIAKERSEGFDIYVTEGAVLNNQQKLAYDALGMAAKEDKKESKLTAQQYMCKRFFDVRTFGAVMDTGDYKCGQVRGPIQLCFAKSTDSILQQEVTITRMASTTEKETASANRTMGRKYIIPYALYRAEGFVSAKFAQKTGFSEDDLALFWDALKNMFDHDHSAARGKMVSRKLFAFKHESALGNAPAVTLFDKITAARLGVSKPPRAFADYQIGVNREMPQGVELLELL
ncbi:type I-C CRISPR-associated protein Cas7/Csd2 [Synergistales bacterium]|nr:type I-C CRISPR-associated protein Cas7/Csd2 [Synergistales bacterium]GHV51808.1 type I-C CRISPR-associated protein Cas7/Csd2 [Synergistales bacterium]